MKCTDQRWISVDTGDSEDSARLVQVPCGKCLSCLTNKRSDWSFRLEQEHKASKSAYFVTLTYDEKHKPSDGSLCKRHLQLYIKRLRKKDENSRLRYYAVGEYGTETNRPHYHILLFNSTEEHIRKAWIDSNGKPVGIVHIGKVTPASVAYCLKYVIQKGDFPDGLLKPFATMSRAYGIGGKYLTDAMVDWHRGGDYNFVLRPGNVKGRLPRFYREKIWYKPKDRLRISSAAIKLVQEQEEKEKQYWKNEFGNRWETAMLESRNAMLSRIKQKIAYTQKL